MLEPNVLGRAVHIAEDEQIFSDDGLDRRAREIDRPNARRLRIRDEKALAIGS